MHTQFRLLQQEARDKGKPRHSIEYCNLLYITLFYRNDILEGGTGRLRGMASS